MDSTDRHQLSRVRSLCPRRPSPTTRKIHKKSSINNLTLYEIQSRLFEAMGCRSVFLVYVAAVAMTVQSDSPGKKYSIVIDAGSSHTKCHVFTYDLEDDGAPLTSKPVFMEQLGEHDDDLKTGNLSFYKDDPKTGAAMVKSVLDVALNKYVLSFRSTRSCLVSSPRDCRDDLPSSCSDTFQSMVF